jgi:adenosylcobinamide kinase / adenosylcobinamide-phosphate guanylyltransferase
MRELILGGQKSGKSRRAEEAARQWLAASPVHKAVLIATAQAGDDEMRERIARHQADRALRVPQMQLVQEPLHLAQAIHAYSRSDTMVVVDCLTLWLTNWLMPAEALKSHFSDANRPLAQENAAQAASLLIALENCQGPVVLISNEIGQGVVPMGREVRAFVDTLGRLHQDLAQRCERVTLMVAGYPVTVKGAA